MVAEELQARLGAQHIKCMAFGGAGDVLKFYFFAQVSTYVRNVVSSFAGPCRVRDVARDTFLLAHYYSALTYLLTYSPTYSPTYLLSYFAQEAQSSAMLLVELVMTQS